MTYAPDFAILGPWTCSMTLAGYCMPPKFCPATPDDVIARFCREGGPSPTVERYRCGDKIVVDVDGIDTVDRYVFDASGLYAVYGRLNLDESCAGPSTFELIACGPETILCSRY